jgi:hypothetical protein
LKRRFLGGGGAWSKRIKVCRRLGPSPNTVASLSRWRPLCRWPNRACAVFFCADGGHQRLSCAGGLLRGLPCSAHVPTNPIKKHRRGFWPSAPCGFPIVRAYPMERFKRTWSDCLRPHDQKMPPAPRPSGQTHIDRDVREDANAVQIGASDTSRLTMRGRVA